MPSTEKLLHLLKYLAADRSTERKRGGLHRWKSIHLGKSYHLVEREREREDTEDPAWTKSNFLGVKGIIRAHKVEVMWSHRKEEESWGGRGEESSSVLPLCWIRPFQSFLKAESPRKGQNQLNIGVSSQLQLVLVARPVSILWILQLFAVCSGCSGFLMHSISWLGIVGFLWPCFPFRLAADYPFSLLKP